MKNWKPILFVTLLIGLCITSVMAWHWEETAKNPFWYNLWPYLGVASIIGFIGLIYWFGKSENKW